MTAGQAFFRGHSRKTSTKRRLGKAVRIVTLAALSMKYNKRITILIALSFSLIALILLFSYFWQDDEKTHQQEINQTRNPRNGSTGRNPVIRQNKASAENASYSRYRGDIRLNDPSALLDSITANLGGDDSGDLYLEVIEAYKTNDWQKMLDFVAVVPPGAARDRALNKAFDRLAREHPDIWPDSIGVCQKARLFEGIVMQVLFLPLASPA
jgi:hypothetical protein